MLRNFGHLLTDINFDICQLNELIFEDVVRYCSGGQLHNLRMKQIQLASKLISSGANLLENLKSLYTIFYDDEYESEFFVRLLPMCTKLESLHLINCAPKAEQLNQLTVTNLTELSLTPRVFDSSSLTPSIEQFLLRHKLTISKLEMDQIKHFNLAIFEQMTALEELRFRFWRPKYVQFGESDGKQLNFKKIEIYYFDKRVSKFLNRLAPRMAQSLQHLDLKCTVDNSFTEGLNSIQNLVSLRVED